MNHGKVILEKPFAKMLQKDKEKEKQEEEKNNKISFENYIFNQQLNYHYTFCHVTRACTLNTKLVKLYDVYKENKK